ncbi:hypothetical protein GPZ81_20550 [Burkholderia pseudomallei]|nr:hypothetical protein BOC36_05445 [Burkholderia pseudomallei]ARK68057.1 hypothetical protein BOC38_15990 [Burkholderia pseudomallei]ARK77357.1 hypothetical protein BOC39_28745 [Burkholderia pseudomallei]ARL10048.1 hypothetical protein BOC45_15645 [Burkholderia pseudomallei]ARL14783.1 hypothetical protein BOC46_03920 [Burkholderia pseudomallei]
MAWPALGAGATFASRPAGMPPAVFRRAVCRGMSAAWAASYVSCIPRAGHVRRIRRTHPAHPARTRATPAETKPDRKRLEPGSERFGAQTAKPLFVL